MPSHDAGSFGPAIVEAGAAPNEFKDPIIYSSHPDVVSKKAEYKASGSLSDRVNSSTFYSNFYLQYLPNSILFVQVGQFHNDEKFLALYL